MRIKLGASVLSVLGCFLVGHTLAASSSYPNNIPYGNSAYLYPGDYDTPAQGPHNPNGTNYLWNSVINTFNSSTSDVYDQFQTIYPYASDIEFACVSFPVPSSDPNIGPSTPQLSSPVCHMYAPNAANQFPANTDVSAKPGVGYAFGDTTPPYAGTKGDTLAALIADYAGGADKISYDQSSGTPKATTVVPLIDGRIDNGYMQGFNQPGYMRPEDIRGLADLIANGQWPSGAGEIQRSTSLKAGGSVTGMCAPSYIKGVQMDIEPFSLQTATDPQAVFYSELGKDLHACNKFYSIFAFAETLTPAAIDVLKKYDNAYVTDSLYDLPYNNNAPIGNDHVHACNSTNKGSFGCKNAVPTEPETYEQYAVTEVHNMLKIAAEHHLAFKFAVPAAGSAHEFEAMYPRNYVSSNSYYDEYNSKKKGSTQIASCSGTNAQHAIPGTYQTTPGAKDNYKNNPEHLPAIQMMPGCGVQGTKALAQSTVAQSTYLKTVMHVVSCAFNGAKPDYYAKAAEPYFKGFDVWEFSHPGTAWSPNNAIIDWNSAYISVGKYVFFSPASPSNAAQAYLKANMDVLGKGAAKPQPTDCPTFPAGPAAAKSFAKPTNVHTDIECTRNKTGDSSLSCTATVSWDQSQGDKLAVSNSVGLFASPEKLIATSTTGNKASFTFKAAQGVPYFWQYKVFDSANNTIANAASTYDVGTYQAPALKQEQH